MKKRKKTVLQFLTYVSPWIIGFLCFGVFPMGYSLYMSFCSYQMVGEPKFVGLQNYIDLFTSERYFFKTLENTFVFMGFTTVLGLGLGLAFCYNIDARRFIK